MKLSNNSKLNDLSKSKLRDRFYPSKHKAETNLAVAMGRVSTRGQKERGLSDEAQLETIKKYLKEQKLDLARDPWDVAETASKHDRRKSFNEMLAYVRGNPRVKNIIFSHQSRSNRNRESARELEDLVRQHGVTLHCVRDNLKLTKESPIDDWLRWDLFNNLNEQYIRDHTKNVMDGTIKRIEAGYFPGKAPIGYQNYRPSENEPSVFIIDPDTAPYVKRSFELWATGRYSISVLMTELDKEYPTQRFTGKKPAQKYMEKILKNPFYYGDFDYSGERYEGAHEPLITLELWKKAQVAFESRGWGKQCKKEGHVFTRLIRCGGKILDNEGRETDKECGCAVTATRKSKKLKDGSEKYYTYWHCSNTTFRCSQKSGSYMKKIGLTPYIRQEELVNIMADVFKPLNFPVELGGWMQKLLMEQHEGAQKEYSEKLKVLQERFHTLDGFINQAYEDKLAGKIQERTWAANNERWQQEQTSVNHELSAIQSEKQDYINTGALLIELCQRIGIIYEKADPEVKRKMLDIVSLNQVLRNGSIEFHYKKPFDILAKCDSNEKWWRWELKNNYLKPLDISILGSHPLLTQDKYKVFRN